MVNYRMVALGAAGLQFIGGSNALDVPGVGNAVSSVVGGAGSVVPTVISTVIPVVSSVLSEVAGLPTATDLPAAVSSAASDVGALPSSVLSDVPRRLQRSVCRHRPHERRCKPSFGNSQSRLGRREHYKRSFHQPHLYRWRSCHRPCWCSRLCCV